MDIYQKTILAAVLIIIGLSGGFWLGGGMREGGTAAPRSTPPSINSGQATLPPPSGELLTPLNLGTASLGGNAVLLNDQPPGTSVALGMVTLAMNGWVVIHEEENGKPGRILGARRFDAGMNRSGNVELLRPTEEGKVYFAMLHADDGDRQFDHTKDLPLQDPKGNAILMRFVTAAEAQ